MILCLDVGNSHIFGGVFNNKRLDLRFRHDTLQASTSDQLGIFLRSVLRENDIDYHSVNHIGISSVVPSLDYSLAAACVKYFDIQSFFLQAGAKTGLKIKTKNPAESGADLIATAIAATSQFSGKNIIVIDFGTATTYSIINKQNEYLGCIIQAGIKTSMNALQLNTAKLPPVRIIEPKNCMARNTISAIQSGLYYGQLGALHQIIAEISQDTFKNEAVFIVGTGGFANLFENKSVFDVVIPDLVLQGIHLALQMNI